MNDEIYKLVQNPTFWVVSAWLAEKIYQSYAKNNQVTSQAIRELGVKIAELTVSIVRLETKLQSIEQFAFSIPKLQQDLNVLHARVRTLDPTISAQ